MSCGNDVEDELALALEEPVANPGATIGTIFSVLHKMFCHLWLAVFLDHWPTHLNIRVLHEELKVVSENCCFLYVCTLPLAVITVVRFLDTRTVFPVQLGAVLEFWSTRAGLLRFTLLNNSLRWTLLSRIFMWCNVPFENRTVRSDPKGFVLFRKIDLDFGVSLSCNTQPTCFTLLQQSNRSLSTTFLRLFAGLTVSVPEQTLIAECASRFRFVILTYQEMPIIIRRIRTISFKVISAQFFQISFQKDYFSWRSFLSKVFFRHFVCDFEAREDYACCPRLFPWLELQASPLEHLSICFPLIAFSHSPFNAKIFLFLTLDQNSCLKPFISDSDVSRSDCLINVSSYHCLQLLITWHRSTFDHFLVHTLLCCLKLYSLTYSHLVQTFHPEHYLWAFQFRTIELDPILHQNLENRRLVKRH